MRAVPLTVALLALSACHASVDVGNEAKEQGDNVHIAMRGGDSKDHVSIQVPGLSANVTLPGLNLAGHVNLDGITLEPATEVKTVDVQDHDDDAGDSGHRVTLDFTNPGAPASLIEYYRKAAGDAGYTAVAATATGVSAAKGKKKFALSVAPEAKGSRGRIVMSGAD